jgi:PTH1 family peptidyl-tRNA hydrolase
MNLSGMAVSALLKKYKIDSRCFTAEERTLNNLLVVCDDLDLEFGRCKIRPSGSSGGHRGLKAIIDTLNCQKFCRLRIGIGRAKGNTDPARYVLNQFTKKEKGQVKEMIDEAIACCQVWVAKGITVSMNIFNRRK